MDYPLDTPIKVEKEDLECNNNANIQELLFDVEIKVENEALTNESDWCVPSFNNPGDLIEPLFFKQLTEHLAQKCPLCHRYFTDDYSMLKHNLDHLHVIISNPTLFQCDRCASYFTDKHAMEHHISSPKCRTVYGPNLPCNVNPSKTLTLKYKPKAYIPMNSPANTELAQKYIKTYKAKHNTVKKLQDGITNMLKYKPKSYKAMGPKSKQLHECKICNKMFTYTHWHAHMSEVHGEGGFYCGICNMEFKCERYFMKHMRKKHNERFAAQKKMPPKQQDTYGYEKVNINCDECDAVLQCMYALKTHKRNVHSNEKYVCNVCKSTLKCKSYYLSHMRRVHYNDGKKHACECGKMFKSPRYLAIHKKNAHKKK